MPEVAYEEKSTKTKVAAIQALTDDKPTPPASNTDDKPKSYNKRGKKGNQKKQGNQTEDMAAMTASNSSTTNIVQQKQPQLQAQSNLQ